jgi:zinc protease
VLPPTLAALRIQLARATAFDILSMRLQSEIKKDPASFGASGAAFNETFGLFTESSVQIASRSGNWMRAMVTVEHELRRALRHGFTGSEVALSTTTGLAGIRYAAERAPTRKSEEITQEILGNLMLGRITQSPAEKLALAQPILNSLTPQECLDAFRALWPDDRRIILVNGALRLRDPVKEIGEIYESSLRFPLVENDDVARDEFAYTSFGPAGRIAKRTHVDDLDIHLVQFGNGVRLNLKRTDFTAGTIVLRLRLGGGLSSEPPDRPGLGLLTAACFLDSALGRHDSDAVNRIVRGSSITLNFSVEDDAFVFTGGTDGAHLRLLLQLITAYLTDPGWRTEGWTTAGGHLGSFYSNLSNDTTGFAAAVGPKIVCDGDSRYGGPRFDDVRRRTLAHVESWLGPQLGSGPIEIGVAGDMDVESVIVLAAETLGTLPARASRSTLPSRPVHPLKKTTTIETTIPSHSPKATVWIAWILPGNVDVTVSRRVDLMTVILGNRIQAKTREELGATYDAAAYPWDSQADPHFGLLITQMTTPPSEARRLAAIVQRISSELAREGVSEDEFERARQPILASLEQRMRDNGYWLSLLDRAQEQPARLDWPRTRERDYRTITREEINVLARQYLGSERAYSILVTPKP